MSKTAVVFVHGFGSNAATWDRLKTRLSSDPLLADYSFDCFPYPTKWFNWNPIQRIPSLRELGEALGGFLKLNYSTAENLILVGHSQGGLIIQSYLQQKTTSHQAGELANIRTAILLATPNRGSDIFSAPRRFASIFNPNPQERTLRVLNSEIAEMSKAIDRDILNASAFTDNSCPIPFRAFYGLSDRVVPEASAKGSFPETGALPGDHLTIHQVNKSARKPDDCDPRDLRYTTIRDAIVNPIGHPAIFEIDLIDVQLEVSPYPADKPFVAHHGTTTREFVTDNRANRVMSITFSPANRCARRYQIEYKTKSGGFVACNDLSKNNEASRSQLSTYDDTGTQLTYLFTPRPGETVSMDIDIYKGFDAGNRDWHNHIPDAADILVHCKLYRLTLNLKPWIDAGFQISPTPTLLVHKHDLMDIQIKTQQPAKQIHNPLPQTTPGIWTWEIPEIRIGALALTWDLAPARAAQAS
jgi:pimeloyl-ACP methyl ester carboxylesterase